MEGIPVELFGAFVADPSCQLRYTCWRFYKEIPRKPFTRIDSPNGCKMVSDWYVVTVPQMNNSNRDYFTTGEVSTFGSSGIGRIFEKYPEYLLLNFETDRGSLYGTVVRSRALLPYLVGIDGCDLYEYTKFIQCGNKRPIWWYKSVSFMVNPSEIIVTDDPPASGWKFIYVNDVDVFDIPYLKYLSTPALLYRKMSRQDIITSLR